MTTVVITALVSIVAVVAIVPGDQAIVRRALVLVQHPVVPEIANNRKTFF